MTITIDNLLPRDASAPILIGRVYDPEVGGPCVVSIQDGFAYDITDKAPTTTALFASDDFVSVATKVSSAAKKWSIESLIDSMRDLLNPNLPRLLAPIDLQVVKAAGVTFVASMLERVIEERALGNPASAHQIRERLISQIGHSIASVKPGSVEAQKVKEVLMAEGLWSQYL